MPSPFPGMDPWLENPSVFPSLHHALMGRISDALNEVLPERYVSTIATRIWTDDDSLREPDVSVFGSPRRTGTAAVATAALPGLLQVGFATDSDPMEETYLEIVSARGKRLVTAFEILSPSNKRGGKGRKKYLKKQREYRRNSVNSVEIDLLRGGKHTTSAPLRVLQKRLGEFDYHACVYRAGRTGEFFAVGIRLGDPLPTVGIPLDPGDEPVTLDLQSVFTRCYDLGRFSKLVDYTDEPIPPLTPEQQTWTEGILKGKGVL